MTFFLEYNYLSLRQKNDELGADAKNKSSNH